MSVENHEPTSYPHDKWPGWQVLKQKGLSVCQVNGFSFFTTLLSIFFELVHRTYLHPEACWWWGLEPTNILDDWAWVDSANLFVQCIPDSWVESQIKIVWEITFSQSFSNLTTNIPSLKAAWRLSASSIFPSSFTGICWAEQKGHWEFLWKSPSDFVFLTKRFLEL